nr:MAG TPA: hypothetical protein [Caudoviricetes sp.]
MEKICEITKIIHAIVVHNKFIMYICSVIRKQSINP